MDIEKIELHDCPLCNGAGLLEVEGGDCYTVSCLDCGCSTVGIPFSGEADRYDAAQRAATLWNKGKVISEGVGE